MRTYAPLALALTLLAGTPAAAGDARKTWDLGMFCWVKVAAAEKGAKPNGHPAHLDPQAVAQALGTVRIPAEGGKDEALFSAEELPALGKAVSEALATAGPGDDLEVLSTRKRERGIFAPTLTVACRVFAVEGRLNLIAKETRGGFYDRYRAEGTIPIFDYGTRTQAGKAIISAPDATSLRPDWIALTLAPVVQAPAAPAGAPAAAPAAAAPKADPAAGLEERLRKLKDLRDKGLITEDVYTRKCQELLKEI